MRYHLVKASRIDEGKPYKGPASGDTKAQADTLMGAKSLQAILTVANPVGWVIIDTRGLNSCQRIEDVKKHKGPINSISVVLEESTGKYYTVEDISTFGYIGQECWEFTEITYEKVNGD
jgi:hypothetical protein